MSRVKEDMTKALSTFIWTFKKGDNIIYNFEILEALYSSKQKAYLNEKKLFNKPIILIIISIIECIFEDFTKRAKYRTRDPLPNLTLEQEQEYKTKQYDKLEHFIGVARKHNLFDSKGTIYDALDYLRRTRNRIHIQNNKSEFEDDEFKVFTDKRLQLSEMVLEIIIKKMVEKFPRQEADFDVDKLKFPWT